MLERSVLECIGGEQACRDLARRFYQRVAGDEVLRPLFPGKSLRCATEELSAFLIQFLGGDESETQYRWWLSLKASHARFQIDERQRVRWLSLMSQTVMESGFDEDLAKHVNQFFERVSKFLVDDLRVELTDPAWALLWSRQETLEDLAKSLSEARDQDAISLAMSCTDRPSVFLGALWEMLQTGRPELWDFVLAACNSEPCLATARFNGKSMLHYACMVGHVNVVALLLGSGANPDEPDAGGHSPLYRAAGNARESLAMDTVKTLVAYGADVNAAGGVMRATPLHQAARRGRASTAKLLVELGARVMQRDKNHLTALDRARRGKHPDLADWMEERLRGMTS